MNNRAIVLLFSVAVLVLYLLIVPSDLPSAPPPPSIYPSTPSEDPGDKLDGANEDYYYPDSIEEESSYDIPPSPPNGADEDDGHDHEYIPPYDSSIPPENPSIPSNPSNPTNPTTPITPTDTFPTPSDPTAPLNPTTTPSPTPSPATPTNPNDPLNPTPPTTPTNPTNPTDPLNPSPPTTPTPPTPPTNPTTPTDTTPPTNPTTPTDTTPPTTPTTPTDSTNPTTTPASTQRTPRIKHIKLTEADNDTTAGWLDDDGSLRFVTLFYKPDIETLQALRRLVGSIHYFEHEKIRLTVFGLDVPQSYYEEVRTFSFVRYVSLAPSNSGSPENFVVEQVVNECKTMYAKFLFVPLTERVMLNGEGLAKLVQEYAGSGPIRVSLDSKDVGIVGQIRGDGTTEIAINGTLYLTKEAKDEYGRCTLLRNITSPFRTKFVYAHDNHFFVQKEDRREPEDRLVCVAIATYSGGVNFENIDDFSLIKVVLPSFLESTREIDTPNSRYRFAIYLGTQPDPLYDDAKKLEALQRKIVEATSDRSFSLRMFHTPLNAPAMDITYKWNVLIDQSYRDGCDYIYQYSDDTIFVTPWADQFISYLEAESNFGVVGATDPAQTSPYATMTLSFAHRSHVTMLGSYWPTHLKNWFSDDWAQQVYGQRYTYRSKDVLMSNTQQHGQRYPACGHGGLFNKLMKEESRPKIIEWLKKQPQTYDIRQKLYYFEFQGAEGEKK